MRSRVVVAAAGSLAVLAVLLPWYRPTGELGPGTLVPTRTLYGWQLGWTVLLGAFALGSAGIAAGVIGGRPQHAGPAWQRRLLWTAVASALVALAGAYFAWRGVPAHLGVGQRVWESATVNGYSASTGAQPGLWLFVGASLVALLGAARQLRIVLRVIALSWLFGLVALPVLTVTKRAFASGADVVWQVITTDPEFRAAAWLTVQVAGIAVVLNTVFGVGISLLLVRYRFPGRRLLSTLVDLPLAISPVVVGVALILVYGQQGWFGEALQQAGFQVIFATPGMVLATVIVALPLVVREVVPVLQEAGIEQEQAAASLGAGPWQVFRRITLPTIKWALAYGVVLSLARSIGEFGAVRVVSQSVAMESQTLTLFVNREYEQLGQVHKDNAFIGSFVLMVVAVVFIVVIALLKPKERS